MAGTRVQRAKGCYRVGHYRKAACIAHVYLSVRTSLLHPSIGPISISCGLHSQAKLVKYNSLECITRGVQGYETKLSKSSKHTRQDKLASKDSSFQYNEGTGYMKITTDGTIGI